MARNTKKTLSTQGKSIMALAKKIRKTSPRKKWTTCVKEAGKEWKRKKKVGG